ncbi:butyrate kinase [Exiguobacterium profundum]|uniref:butyrate kinase n=1 Tax=Exiguobacterium TaxID=33986 RepID=UPI0018DAD129|nr:MULTISPECIES: butyrate kinase [Exiguobacterium]MCT4797139.1 butyrate kinase [Exiguobacterium profundum]MDT0191822.1 butyrate kinase [Exiguobacterium sp. BG5(2022)]QPI68854.1 butyrate kinase [Exiguobacterium sp. PBE]
MTKRLILAINPGSTSTKVGLFDGKEEVMTRTVRHSIDVTGLTLPEQLPHREQEVRALLEETGIAVNDLTAIVGRGGLLAPMTSGTYTVNDLMREDLTSGRFGMHASNLGGLIASKIGGAEGIPSFIVDPVVVDEMDELARKTGMPEINRRSIFHALNQKAVAKRFAAENGSDYNEMNLIVAHLGGGITVGAHAAGRVIDVNNGLDGDGPLAPERAGSIPVGQVVELCYSTRYKESEMKKKIVGQGGLFAHLGTFDAIEIEQRVESGDDEARLLYETMAYRVAQEISKHGATLCGRVDAILLTGGIAYSEWLTEKIKERVTYLAPVHVYPGEDELKALAEGALRVIEKEETARVYEGDTHGTRI